jgi:hypothetical protein
MGQVCSSKDRRRQRESGQLHLFSEPPPYTDIANRSAATDFGNKEDAPDLDNHPAFRNSQASIGEYFLKSSRRPISAPGNQSPTRPAPSHARSQSFLDISPLPSPTPTLPRYTSPSIHVNSIPQWRWTNSQCRTWVTDVLIVYGGKDPQTAQDLAAAFRGFGPNLYMKEWKQWNSWLGADGQAIFALLMEVHAEEGAVPKEVEIAHYQREVRPAFDRAVSEGVLEEDGSERGEGR